MKRLFSICLILSLFLSGCGIFGPRISEPVTFYYLQKQYGFGEDTGVLGQEEREAAGHRDDLSYLLALYLMGPADEELRSPIPLGTNIYVDTQTENLLKLKLTDTSATLTDARFTLACACLAKTCFGITGTEEVTIISGSRSVTMTPETLILFDNSTAETTEELQ